MYSVRAFYQAPVIWKSPRGRRSRKGTILQPGRVQKSLLLNDGELHADWRDLSRVFRQGSLDVRCIKLDANHFLRQIYPTRLGTGFEIRHPVHDIASSADHGRIYRGGEESFIHEYTKTGGAGGRRLGKTRLILLAASRRVAPGRPAVLRCTKMFLRGMQPGIRTWKSLTIASTSFDKRSSHIPAVLRFPAWSIFYGPQRP